MDEFRKVGTRRVQKFSPYPPHRRLVGVDMFAAGTPVDRRMTTGLGGELVDCAEEYSRALILFRYDVAN